MKIVTLRVSFGEEHKTAEIQQLWFMSGALKRYTAKDGFNCKIPMCPLRTDLFSQLLHFGYLSETAFIISEISM